MTVPPGVGWSVLALVFVDEVLVMVALGIWAAWAGPWWLAALTVVGGVLVWFLFASPRARYGGPVVRPVVKLLVFGAGVVGLWVAGHPAWALALAAFSLVVNVAALHPDIRDLPGTV